MKMLFSFKALNGDFLNLIMMFHMSMDLTVNQRAITLRADDRSKTYGDAQFGATAFGDLWKLRANSETTRVCNS